MNLNNLSDTLSTNLELGSSGTPQLRISHKKDLKMFSSIGGLQSRINFLHTCILNDVIPKGFSIVWKEQTGLNSQDLSSKISAILASSSKLLLNQVLESSKAKFEELVSTFEDKKTKVPEVIWLKGIQNYNFCFAQTSQRLTKKIQKLSHLSSLQVCLPHNSEVGHFQVEGAFLAPHCKSRLRLRLRYGLAGVAHEAY